MQKEAVLENLVLQYEGYFNIERPFLHDGREFLFYGRFIQRQEKYVLVRRATLYAFETHEHVFVVSADELDDATFEDLSNFITHAEADFVEPNPEHMFSYITLIILCGHITESAREALRRFHFTKNYKLSTQGYSTVRIGAVELPSERVETNKAGRKDVKCVLERALRM